MNKIFEIISKAKAVAAPAPIVQPHYFEGQLLSIITNIVNVIFAIGGGLAVIYIIWGGIIYLTAGSDENKAKQGRDTLTYAIIGLVVIALSFTIIRWLVTVIGFSNNPAGLRF